MKLAGTKSPLPELKTRITKKTLRWKPNRRQKRGRLWNSSSDGQWKVIIWYQLQREEQYGKAWVDLKYTNLQLLRYWVNNLKFEVDN